MARLLLIHGSGHGAWCWEPLVAELAGLGHEGVAIDLPSHGEDPADPSTVTLAHCVARASGGITPGTIVVGHSLGGITATLAADARAGEVRAVVYLAAWVPRPGLALSAYRGEGATAALLAATKRGPVPDTTVFDPAVAADLLYPDCAEAVGAAAVARLCPQPVSVMTTVVTLDHPPPERFYIRCLRDRAIDPAYQRRVSADWPPDRVFEIDAGHSPFLSQPARLAAILDTIAKAVP